MGWRPHSNSGVRARRPEDKISDYENDYAMRTATEVITIIKKLCTLRPGACADAALNDHVLAISGGITVDGALLKTANFLKTHWMHNVRVIVRDPCHIIRPSCKNPLDDADKFQEQSHRLFGGKKSHGVLKDIQNSVQWQNHQTTVHASSTPSSKTQFAPLQPVRRRRAERRKSRTPASWNS